MKKFGLLLGTLLLTGSSAMFGQMEKSIRLNEVMTDNLQDEYGKCEAWVEIANVSYTTYNIRGMYLTTDRSVLDKKISVPERVKRMSIIPNGEPRTNLGARQHLLLFCNGTPAQGALHLDVKIDPGKPTWIGLFSGNATDEYSICMSGHAVFVLYIFRMAYASPFYGKESSGCTAA